MQKGLIIVNLDRFLGDQRTQSVQVYIELRIFASPAPHFPQGRLTELQVV